MRRQVLVTFSFALTVIFAVAPAWAQRTTATFAGIVVDTSGGALPGATIELVNEDTGIAEQPQVTGATGEFVFNYVPVGKYTLSIALPGFKTYKSTGVRLGAAQNVRQKYELEVGAIAENVTVSGVAPLVNAVSPEQRIYLEPLEVKTLPTANRNISNILNIGTGLTKQEGIEGRGGATRLRLNGLGGGSMSVTANGTEASGNAGSRQLSQYNSISKIDVMSIEAVAEVQIVKGVVPAEYGLAMGGNVNITSRSGTNAWHGGLFQRYEGSALSARPQLLAVKPDSRWNQYGGSLGGPIRRDKAFFFTAFEGYRQHTSNALNANVPTERFRDLALAALPYPETKLWLDMYPLPNQPVAQNALSGVFIGAGPKENTDDHVDLRTDYRVMGGNLSATFTAGHPYLAQAQALPQEIRVWKSNSRRAAASYAFARGRWSSETRFGYSYNWLSRTDQLFTIVDPVKPATIPGQRSVAFLGFPGLTSFQGEQHIRGLIPSYSFAQQASLVTNKHSFKFGGIYSLPRGGRRNIESPRVSFQTLDDLLANRPSQVSFTLGSPESTWSTTNYGFFVQDDWRVNPKLVVNLGVRYDFFGRFRVYPTNPDNPAGIFNLDGLQDRKFTFGPKRDPARIFEDDGGVNLGPRIGFAYNVDGAGTMIVRGGWGMMFQPIDVQNFEPSIGESFKVPRGITYSGQEAAARGIRWPVYNEDAIVGVRGIQSGPDYVTILIDPHIQAPYATVFTVGVQRALTSSMVADIAYVGTQGHNFTMSRTYNEPDRLTGIRPNPALSQGGYYDHSQRTSYHSLQTSLRQQFAQNVAFNLNYTWSKALAHVGGDGTPGFIGDTINSVQDFFDLDSAWGPASGDVTHLFIGSVIYELPPDRFESAPARHLMGGWQFAGIFRASTGLPLLVTQSSQRSGSRPDVVDFANAIDLTCCSIGNLQYLNREAFALVPLSPVTRQTIRAGNVGNGAFRGPGYRNLDLSIVKSIPLGSQRRLELRSDMLNVLNLSNYTTIQTSINASNFGRATGLANARVIQVQARFGF
ncbi:MAG: TonB-dependent receptor [Acidobacteria bacterium]|nr:TonB-dependent receptor [Acidobacteriota bacterium]